MPETTQKTAMQILRDRLQARINEESTNSEIIAAAFIINLINTEMMAIERQNIINAVDGFPICNRDLNGEEYYLKTYNPK